MYEVLLFVEKSELCKEMELEMEMDMNISLFILKGLP